MNFNLPIPSTLAQARQFVSVSPTGSLFIGKKNTLRLNADGSVSLIFYESEIVRYNSDDSVTLFGAAAATGGKISPSTAKRIADVLAFRGKTLDRLQLGNSKEFGYWVVRPIGVLTLESMGQIQQFQDGLTVPA